MKTEKFKSIKPLVKTLKSSKPLKTSEGVEAELVFDSIAGLLVVERCRH